MSILPSDFHPEIACVVYKQCGDKAQTENYIVDLKDMIIQGIEQEFLQTERWVCGPGIHPKTSPDGKFVKFDDIEKIITWVRQSRY